MSRKRNATLSNLDNDEDCVVEGLMDSANHNSYFRANGSGNLYRVVTTTPSGTIGGGSGVTGNNSDDGNNSNQGIATSGMAPMQAVLARSVVFAFSRKKTYFTIDGF